MKLFTYLLKKCSKLANLFLHRFPFAGLMILVLMFTSCGRVFVGKNTAKIRTTPTHTAQNPSLTPTSTNTTVPVPTLISPSASITAYNYSLNGIGEGWNEGLVQLAFENSGGVYITHVAFDFSDAYVETQEGITYPVEILSGDAGHVYGFGEPLPENKVVFDNLFIPPGFRWDSSQPWEDEWYFLKFQAATSTRPIRIVLPRHPEIILDLETALTSKISFPTDNSTLREIASPIYSLRGKVLVDDPEGISVHYTGGAYVNGQSLYLGVVVTNHDNYYERNTTSSNPASAIYYSNGGTAYYDFGQVSFSAGPGQTIFDYILIEYVFLWNCDPAFYLTIFAENTNAIYSLDSCSLPDNYNDFKLEPAYLPLRTQETQVQNSQPIFLFSAWVAKTPELTNDFLDSIDISGRIDGFLVDDTSSFWSGVIETEDIDGDGEKDYVVTWIYPIGVLLPGNHTVILNWEYDNSVISGFDDPDLTYVGPSREFKIAIHVSQ